MVERKEGFPFLEPGVCIYCNAPIQMFSITPIIESEDSRRYHEMCEKCADENEPGWRDDDE